MSASLVEPHALLEGEAAAAGRAIEQATQRRHRIISGQRRRVTDSDRADLHQLAAEGGEAVLRGDVEHEVELSVVAIVEARLPRDRALRERHDLVRVRARPGVGIGERVHAGGDRGGIALVNVAARGPDGEDGLLSRPLVPELAEVVDVLGREALDRVDRGVADQQRRIAVARALQRAGSSR